MNKFQPILDKATNLRKEGKYHEALKVYDSIEEIKRLTPDQQSEVLLSRAYNYAKLSDYDNAKKFYLEALQRAKLRDRWVEQTNILFYLASLEKEHGHINESLKLFRKQLSKLSSEFPNYFYELARNYYQQGLLMVQKEELADARMYLKHAMTYSVGNSDAIHAYATMALGKLDMLQNKRKDALKNLRTSYELFKRAEIESGVQEVIALITKYEKKYFNK